MSTDIADQRDYAEEAYNRDLCPACDYSPCVGGPVAGDCLRDCLHEHVVPVSEHDVQCLDCGLVSA